jgi:hypothetical protein
LVTLIPDSSIGRDPAGNKLLSVNDKTVTLLFNEMLLVYDHQQYKLQSSWDLSDWQPFGVKPDGKIIWLVSKKDGLLYGLSM